jgi:hypothetical protein
MATPTVTLVDNDVALGALGLAVLGCAVGEIDPSDTGGFGALGLAVAGCAVGEFDPSDTGGTVCLVGALVGAPLGSAPGVKQRLGRTDPHVASDRGRHSSNFSPAAACHASATPSAATPIACSSRTMSETRKKRPQTPCCCERCTSIQQLIVSFLVRSE